MSSPSPIVSGDGDEDVDRRVGGRLAELGIAQNIGVVVQTDEVDVRRRTDVGDPAGR